MAVFRIEKTQNYTVMSNHHLRNAALSLKAKGLLSQMLSLPENWDYTLKGLSYINLESLDAIRTAVRELERAGYIARLRERKDNGQFGGVEYVIREQPQETDTPDGSTSTPLASPTTTTPTITSPMTPPTITPPQMIQSAEASPHSPTPPTSADPTQRKPTWENPTQDKSTQENQTQLNKEETNKEKSITDLSSTDSIPFRSTRAHENRTERDGTEAASMSAVEVYREVIHENIEYDYILESNPHDKSRIDEIADLILETVCSARKTIRIAGDDYPAELVKAKFLKLNSTHVEFVLDCMRNNATEIRSIKKYMLAALFNAPSTMNSYYAALVAHDMAKGVI